MTEFFQRIPSAFILAILVFLGLHWAGVSSAYVFAAMAAVVLSALLHVLTGVAVPVAALALLWGLLVWAGVAPRADVAQARVESLIGQTRTEVTIAGNSTPLEDKLAQLKAACDHNVLSAKECEDARARIVEQFTGKP